MPHAIETRVLSRSFEGVQAVQELSLHVRAGEVYGFLGLNGAGKTTTLKMLTTLLRPSAGAARVAGHDVSAEPLEVRRRIGVLNELEGVTQPYWTPEEYLGHFARLRGIPRDEARRRIDALLRRIGIWEVGRVPIGTFSSGMKRKVEVARSLLHDPPVVFLDEPTRELDLPSKREIWDMLDEMVKQRGCAVFLCSHDVREVERLCHRVGVLRQGRLVHEAPMASLHASSVVRVAGRDPGALRRVLAGLPGVREAWEERGAVHAALAPDADRGALLRALLQQGLHVEEFHRASGLEERLTELLQGKAPDGAPAPEVAA